MLDAQNLQLLCPDCNAVKSMMDYSLIDEFNRCRAP